MKNSELAEAFANGKEKGKTKHMFIGNKVIYSYSYHYPICIKTGNNTALINKDRYSYSTTKHNNFVRRAMASKGFILTEADTGILRGMI